MLVGTGMPNWTTDDILAVHVLRNPMSLTVYALLAVALAAMTFFIANYQKARGMGLPQILAFAVKVQANEVRLQVGEQIEFVTPTGTRTLFGSTLKAADYEKHVLGRLNPRAREELAAKGRCQWRFDEKEIGKIVAEVEPARARLTMPRNARNA